MAQARPPFHITIPIYAGVDLLDVAAPVELFSWMAQAWQERTTTISLAAEDLSPIKTRDGLILTPQRRFADYAAPEWQTHLLWVPGGDPATLRRLMQGGPYLDFLKAQSAGADHVSSVCEGALLLAAAGLLDGYRATTHWAFIPCLSQFPAIEVAEGFPRYVISGNRITGGGISSGLDEALALVECIAGRKIAEQVQMTTQYFPQPPFEQTIVPATHCPLDA
ncbi:DJ-1/PfpI family protein [Ralstonia solanacearum]|uniref:DJ-1/PfpI family protein n=1 Tax=Ralstonia solanacearum TaxID=305 RepID=A0AAW5ZJH5_RALSL|nr:DJ-1/PfpI family protein [Ralstonia solanacearum]AST32337.2 DJ-1/PfpI family protein [Ralstonia solanacearum]ATJ86544.1 transcriptional regulator [Ralstonia solanacearum]AYB51596.1 DJ-1/PfpI family protein [Ralstonia solanacearum]AYB56151.1 DJ-1/PfpI family protein [Ralstonia solanacearum]MDB0509364.1 DJ-1/PfpI family protein [Ralstonia solanacearum]